MEEVRSNSRRSVAVHSADVGSSVSAPTHSSFQSSSPPTLSSPPAMTTPPMTPSIMSPPLPSSPIMSPLSPYLAEILTSSPLLSLPSPPTSPPRTYSVIPPVITPAGELLDNEKPVFIIIWNQVCHNLRNEVQSLIWIHLGWHTTDHHDGFSS